MTMTSTGFRQGWRTWPWGRRSHREALPEAVGQPEGGGGREPCLAGLGQRGVLEAGPWASGAEPLLGPRGPPGPGGRIHSAPRSPGPGPSASPWAPSTRLRAGLSQKRGEQPHTVPACSCSGSITPGDPVGCSPPGPSVRGILQARILEWDAMPSSRGSSQPRDCTLSP